MNKSKILLTENFSGIVTDSLDSKQLVDYSFQQKIANQCEKNNLNVILVVSQKYQEMNWIKRLFFGDREQRIIITSKLFMIEESFKQAICREFDSDFWKTEELYEVSK